MRLIMIPYKLLILSVSFMVLKCDDQTPNTTSAATSVESTIGLPVLSIDPTILTHQNTTDSGQYETIIKMSPLSNATNDPSQVTTESSSLFETTTNFTNKSNPSDEIKETDDDNSELAPEYNEQLSKQLAFPDNPFGFLSNRVPCDCDKGICGCCTGMFFSALRQFGCLNITYLPDDFSFELKMIMNNAVLYKSRVTGRNPPPVCVRMPRLNFIKVCASFYDLYFVGRNMHVCLEMGAYFGETEVFNRSFDCMRIGDKGVKIVRPEDGSGLFHKPGTDADIDAGYDEVEDYDENQVVRRRKKLIAPDERPTA